MLTSQEQAKGDRRIFLKRIASAGAFLLTGNVFAKAHPAEDRMISCQEFPWHTFFEREDKDWYDDLSASFAEYAHVPFRGFEPIIENPGYIGDITPYLTRYNLALESLYMGPLLHDRKKAPSNIKSVLSVADEVRPLGTKIFVINPEPIDWGSDQDKTDEQLNVQAAFLNELGEELNSRGIQLAYHNHHHEIRNGAKEFYHVMENTDEINVRLCLDAHWIYRGAGNTTDILADVLDKYVDRIVELHLRQSREGVWTEAFGEGDIDYSAIAAKLRSSKVSPLLVLEQAVEDETSVTMNSVEAHLKSVQYTKEIFG